MTAYRSDIIVDFVETTSSFDGFIGDYFNHNLSVNSSFTYQLSSSITDSNELNSNFTYNRTANISFSDITEPSSGFSGTKQDPDEIENETPDTDPLPEPIDPTVNKVTITFKLFNTPDDGSPFVTIYAPDFGNKDTYRPIRVNEYTRNQSLIIFVNPSWGSENVFEYSFTYLTKAQIDKLKQFLQRNLGQKIKIIDHLGIEKHGLILTPENQIFQPNKNGFSASFQFQELMDA